MKKTLVDVLIELLILMGWLKAPPASPAQGPKFARLLTPAEFQGLSSFDQRVYFAMVVNGQDSLSTALELIGDPLDFDVVMALRAKGTPDSIIRSHPAVRASLREIRESFGRIAKKMREG